MSSLLTVFACCLFAFSAATKAMDWRGLLEVASELGVSRRLASLSALSVLIAEMAVAILLVQVSTRTAGITVLFLLLASFGWAAWKAKGQGIECHCFGAALSEEFGRRTVIRIAACCVLGGYLIAYPSQEDLLSLEIETLLSMVLLSFGIIIAYILLSAIAKHRKTGLSLKR